MARNAPSKGGPFARLRATRPAVCAAVLAPALLVLTACGAPLAGVSKVAESVRTSTEQMAATNVTSNNSREAQIFVDAAKIEEQKLADNPELEAKQARYEVQRDPNGWSVFDLTTGATTRIGSKQQVGLTHEKADEVAYSLQQDENAEKFRQAALASGWRGAH